LNHVDIAKLLLEKGASTDLQNNKGNTPLHLVCFRNYVDIAKLLLQRGASFFIQNNDRKTPLQVAQEFSPEIDRIIQSIGPVSPPAPPAPAPISPPPPGPVATARVDDAPIVRGGRIKRKTNKKRNQTIKRKRKTNKKYNYHKQS